MPRLSTDRAFERRLSALVNSRVPGMVRHGLRGLEKESLRVTADGRLAPSPHPPALGSALLNPNITTDFSEALIELVTPTFPDNDAMIDYLRALQQFVYRNLGDESLWCASMPCELAGDAEVPIAHYGRSHQGHFKEVYRRGLQTRYGGMMQAIAGVHFNFSLPLSFWPVWAEVLQSRAAGKDFISARYFDLLRNFRRHGWIVNYLFGASPALCRSFLQGRADAALRPHAAHTVYGEHATSLRMSDLGYRNRNQTAVTVSVNSLEEYLRDLMHAVHTPHPPFKALGVCVNGEYRQLSANVLQIENEYYSNIRPKRAPRAGELTGQALARDGVQYVEVRSLDLDPSQAESVSASQLCFIEALLITLLIKDSPFIAASEQEALEHNHLEVARRGREPALMLSAGGSAMALAHWAAQLLQEMQGVCELLDAGMASRPYGAALRAQQDKLAQPQLLPAAQQLRELLESGEEFATLALAQSRRYGDESLRGASDERQAEFARQAEESLQQQQRADASVSGTFEQWLHDKLGLDLTPC
jgi:glutamate--cysteine ligase